MKRRCREPWLLACLVSSMLWCAESRAALLDEVFPRAWRASSETVCRAFERSLLLSARGARVLDEFEALLNDLDRSLGLQRGWRKLPRSTSDPCRFADEAFSEGPGRTAGAPLRLIPVRDLLHDARRAPRSGRSFFVAPGQLDGGSGREFDHKCCAGIGIRFCASTYSPLCVR